MECVPDDWPYADDAAVCAACGSDDDRHVVVDSLGLIWGAAMRNGLAPTDITDYSGTLRFRCCHDCWTEAGIDALEDARSLVAREGRGKPGRPFALDDEKVIAAAKLDARRVAVGDLRPLEFRSAPERERVRSQDETVETLLDAWFDRE